MCVYPVVFTIHTPYKTFDRVLSPIVTGPKNVAPSCVFHGVGGVELKGPEAFAGYIGTMRNGFPN
jgi:hypothetical protein